MGIEEQKMSKRWFLFLLIIVGGSVVIYVGQEARKANDNTTVVAAGYADVNFEARMRNVRIEMQNVELERQGADKPDAKVAAERIENFKWAKANFTKDSPMQRKLDQDIAWCTQFAK